MHYVTLNHVISLCGINVDIFYITLIMMRYLVELVSL